MLMDKARSRNREAALATLIELLVQLVFVFTLVLVASETIQGAPGDRGWVSPETWRTLISIFDIDPNRIRDADKQAEEMKKRWEQAKEERDKSKRELEQCGARLSAVEKDLAACQKGLGRGPGYPACRSERGEELVVLRATVNKDGEIVVQVLPSASGVGVERPLDREVIGRPMTPKGFLETFDRWRKYGLSQNPACAYKALIAYDPAAPAGKYEPARRAIASYFNLAAAPREQ